MRSPDLNEHWEAVYADGDATASWTQAHPTKSLAAITTTTRSRDAPILDVGGGSSPLAAELLSAGYTDLTGRRRRRTLLWATGLAYSQPEDG